MRLAVLSDTHLPRGARRLPEACVARVRAADLVLHAGDFVSAAFLDELLALGPPVAAVHGNVDEEAIRRRLPAERVVEAAGARIGMVHDAGPAAGRLARLRARFPDCDAVVFGHSLNPGSPTDRRRQPVHTMGEATVDGGRVSFALVELA
ncbi:MAG: metallophosphoesterase family protein [Solirubrobacterales bacterium]|nr:metallophosphoesterase family protein [Solirubrobacterales bacterium]